MTRIGLVGRNCDAPDSLLNMEICTDCDIDVWLIKPNPTSPVGHICPYVETISCPAGRPEAITRFLTFTDVVLTNGIHYCYLEPLAQHKSIPVHQIQDMTKDEITSLIERLKHEHLLHR